MSLPRVVEVARILVGQALRRGDVAVDATVGRGHDTAWLAATVGPEGRVLGIDVQHHALCIARARLIETGLADRVFLIRARHERLGRLLPDRGLLARPRVVTFNLGYLPGGDRSVVSRPETTIAALHAALARVAPGGLISVVLYPGHPIGREESERVLEWVRTLPADRVNILRCDLLRTRLPGPWLLAISPTSSISRTPDEEPPEEIV